MSVCYYSCAVLFILGSPGMSQEVLSNREPVLISVVKYDLNVRIQ